MTDKIRKYIRAWSPMRFVRLGFGLIIFVQGLMTGDTMSVMLGGAFAGMALLNIGCSGACAINTIGTNNKNNEPEFEEVVIKK